jgi:hypothetical protein
VVKVSLLTKGTVEAKIGFACENAKFEMNSPMARHWFAEEILVPTPSALERRWCEAPAAGTGLSAPQWLTVFFIEFNAAADPLTSIGVNDPFPPAIMNPPSNTYRHRICCDKARFERLLATEDATGRRQSAPYPRLCPRVRENRGQDHGAHLVRDA